MNSIVVRENLWDVEPKFRQERDIIRDFMSFDMIKTQISTSRVNYDYFAITVISGEISRKDARDFM